MTTASLALSAHIAPNRVEPNGIDQAAGHYHVKLSAAQTVNQGIGIAPGFVFEAQPMARLQCRWQMIQLQYVSRVDMIPVFRVFEHQGQDAEIDQVLGMDAGKTFGEHRTQPQKTWCRAACSRLEP